MKNKNKNVEKTLVKKDLFEKFLSYGYSGVIDYDYDRSLCECDPDTYDYCRCTEIIAQRLHSFSKNNFSIEIIKIVKKNYGSLSEIDLYCLSKLLQFQNISTEDFELNICGGYYGEEINGLLFSKKDEIQSKIEELITLSEIEKIKFVLKLEYGYLLPILENISEASVETRKVENIQSRFSDPYSYHKMIDCSEFYGENYTYPRAILFGNILIDGNHRMLEAKKLNLTEVPVIVLK